MGVGKIVTRDKRWILYGNYKRLLRYSQEPFIHIIILSKLF